MSAPTYRALTGNTAENYERFFVPTIATVVATDLLDAASLRPGERVVDVACGTGVIARMAAAAVGPTGSVAGIDVAPEMIAVARTTTTRGVADVAWHVGNAASLPLPDRSQHVALCQMGLMFLDDQAAALREMRRVLVPGGRVALNTPGTMQPPFELLEQAIARNVAPELGGFVRAVFSMPHPDTVSALLAAAGFGEVAATEHVTRLVLPPADEFLWQYLRCTPLGSVVSEAPASSRAALEHDFVESAEPFVVHGRLVVDQPMVVAHAHRGAG